MRNKTQAPAEYNREVHPDWYYPVPGMRALILGTFPPHAGKHHYEFFYPNRQNRFWKVLADIAGMPLTENSGPPAVAQRKALMKKLRVGILNLGLAIERRGKSSLDRDIRILEFQDLLGVIKKNKSLRALLITGYSGPSSTYRSFLRYLKDHDVPHKPPDKVAAGETFTIHVGRPILCVLGNSTSTAAFRSVTHADLVKQFRQALGE